MIQPTALLTSTASALTLAPVATGEILAFDLWLAMLPDATRPSVQPLAAPGKALPSGPAPVAGTGAPPVLLGVTAPATLAPFPAAGQAFTAEAPRLPTTAMHWQPQSDAATIDGDVPSDVPDGRLARDLPEGTLANDDRSPVSRFDAPPPSPVLPLADAGATAPAPEVRPSTATPEGIMEPAPPRAVHADRQPDLLVEHPARRRAPDAPLDAERQLVSGPRLTSPVTDVGPAAVQGRPAVPETVQPDEDAGPMKPPVERERSGGWPAEPTSPEKRADADTADAFPTAQAQPPVTRVGDRVGPESDPAPSSVPVSLATPKPAEPSPVASIVPPSASRPLVADAPSTPVAILSPLPPPAPDAAIPTTRAGGGSEPPARAADLATRIALPGSGAPPLVAGTTAPAFRLFAAAIHAARADESDRTAFAATSVAPVEQPRPILAVASADGAPLDMTDRRWPHAMVERIERLQEQASATRDAASTLIRLVPDALGTIDVGVRRDGDTVRVHFAAENAQTRTLIAEAQPRLQELAEAKGIRLAQGDIAGNIGAGTDGQAQRQPMPRTPARSAPASAVREDEPAAEITDRVA